MRLKKRYWWCGGPERGKSGLLGRVRESLKGAGIEFVELGGVKPNPRYELALEGMELSKKEGVDFVLGRGWRQRYRYGQVYCHWCSQRRRRMGYVLCR